MRSLHERPSNPDAFDLILRARSLTTSASQSGAKPGGAGAL